MVKSFGSTTERESKCVCEVFVSQLHLMWFKRCKHCIGRFALKPLRYCKLSCIWFLAPSPLRPFALSHTHTHTRMMTGYLPRFECALRFVRITVACCSVFCMSFLYIPWPCVAVPFSRYATAEAFQLKGYWFAYKRGEYLYRMNNSSAWRNSLKSWTQVLLGQQLGYFWFP